MEKNMWLEASFISDEHFTQTPPIFIPSSKLIFTFSELRCSKCSLTQKIPSMYLDKTCYLLSDFSSSSQLKDLQEVVLLEILILQCIWLYKHMRCQLLKYRDENVAAALIFLAVISLVSLTKKGWVLWLGHHCKVLMKLFQQQRQPKATTSKLPSVHTLNIIKFQQLLMLAAEAYCYLT